MIYEEKKLPPGMVFLLLCGFFILMYPLWNLGLRDLTRQEGFFAAVAAGIYNNLSRIHSVDVALEVPPWAAAGIGIIYVGVSEIEWRA